MKAPALIVSLLLVNFAFGQASWEDHFEDTDLGSAPPWQGDLADFTVNSQGRLQLQAQQAGTSRIYGRYLASDTLDFDFWFQLGFEPSGSNRLRIYPALNTADPQQGQGLVLSIGETGTSDAVRAYAWDKQPGSLLASGQEGAVAGAETPVRLHLTYRSGTWQCNAAYDGSGSLIPDWQTDWALPESDTFFIIIECTYTSTRKDLFELDDIYAGPPLHDTAPPVVVRAEATSPTLTTLIINEPLVASSFQPDNFILTPGNSSPLNVETTDGTEIQLTWPDPLINGQPYSLFISRLEDLSGNFNEAVVVPLQYIAYEEPVYGDVVFNELMIDPTPSQGLPEAEYIELYNGSEKTLNLGDLFIKKGNTNYPLPKQIILPKSYVLLTSQADAEDFYPISEVTPMNTFPALTNTGARLELYAREVLLHRVDYNTSWYRDGDKDDGGWSLALIDYNHRCGSAGEWIASTAQLGGTPGQANEMDPTLLIEQNARLYSWDVPDPKMIKLTFSQALTQPNGEFTARIIPDLPIDSYVWNTNTPNEILLPLGEAASSNRLYQLNISHLTNCSGLSLADTSVTLGVSRPPLSGDLLWSELLSDPLPGGADFLEVYNNSNSVIDLDSVFVAKTVNTLDDAIALGPLGNILPGQYLAWSPSRPSLQKQYRLLVPGNVYNWALPSLPNDEGSVILFYHDVQGQPQLLDAVHYAASWHNPFLLDPEGYSLERIDFSKNTQDPENWTSGSSSSGGATPGYRNSTQFEAVLVANKFNLIHPVFSPDDDGMDDLAEVNYLLDAPGYVLNASIFDMQGRPVANPYNQYTLSREGILQWDGRDSRGSLMPMGRYVWYLEVFNLKGTVERFKKSVVLAR